jgi:aminopeptidase YwaD
VRIAIGVITGFLLSGTLPALAQKPPLLPERDVAALANELSGETAKRNLEGIARFHRQRGSRGFHSAAGLVAERLRAYGLSDVAILQFPADGKIFYGTQRSRPAWDAEKAELWEIAVAGGCVEVPAKVDQNADQKTKAFSKWMNQDCDLLLGERELLASYEAEPTVLAEDSESADVTADLLDVGEGTRDSDYAGKEVKGKIVLVGAQPGAAQDLAIGKYGAVGLVSYAQNQKTAWSGENEILIRWGHLETFSANQTFAFMVSAKTARSLQARMAAGEKIGLRAVVNAGQHPGNYEVVTATIPGADAKLKEEEIAFSCHLDHQRPGANDNASGCATILEVARTLQKLIDEKKLDRPARTIRFIFPPEVEGTMALLNAQAAKLETLDSNFYSGAADQPMPLRPEQYRSGAPRGGYSGPQLARRIKAVIHMDMVGGGPETKAVFHVTRGPMSLPSFVYDVAWAFADWVNEESYKFAATGSAKYPMVAPEGGREPLRAEYSAFSMGSDHEVYEDSSFGIPAIYLNDWPDRYIHTNLDTAANIDTTKLKRAGFIGAASGYFLAGMATRDFSAVSDALSAGSAFRKTSWPIHVAGLSMAEKCVFWIEDSRYHDFAARYSFARFAEMPIVEFTPAVFPGCHDSWSLSQGGPLFRRRFGPKGPLGVFGYDYFLEHARESNVAMPKLLSYEGSWGGGEEYAYEVLNLADGQRHAQEIRDVVSAEYGPVALEMVMEYLEALEKIGVVEEVK